MFIKKKKRHNKRPNGQTERWPAHERMLVWGICSCVKCIYQPLPGWGHSPAPTWAEILGGGGALRSLPPAAGTAPQWWCFFETPIHWLFISYCTVIPVISCEKVRSRARPRLGYRTAGLDTDTHGHTHRKGSSNVREGGNVEDRRECLRSLGVGGLTC